MLSSAYAYFLLLIIQLFRVNASDDKVANTDYDYPATKYFTQKLDHFNPTIDAEFKQRYLISQQYWSVKGSPIFFYAGNEGDITLFVNNTGFMWDIAPQFKAMVVFAEHRYYGKSKPFADLKPSPETVHKFGQFTVEQALADYAELISYLKATIPGASNSSVIAFGGSYGGMLAAWFRRLYPHIVTGALAASAPVRYFPGLVDCDAYDAVVTKDYAQVNGGKECVENLRNSWSTIDTISKQSDGLKTLTSVFHLCTPLKETQPLKDWLSDAWGSLAMVNYPYPTSFMNPLPAWPVQETCKHLSKPGLKGVDLLNQVREAVGVFANYSAQAECYDINGEASAGLSTSLWYYQTCTEMVMPFCANGVTDMFQPGNWTLAQFTKDCQKKFGTTPRAMWPILEFGGNDWSGVSNIIFSNGELDPWRTGGILAPPSDKIVTFTMKDAAHHLDLRHKNKLDPQSVTEGRNLEIKTIATWLSGATRNVGKV